MSWTDWTLLGVFIVGFLLFLIGANITLWNGTASSIADSSIIGYSGIYLSIGSVAAYLIIYIYKELTKKKPC
jgi:hypothetical protein